MTMNAKLAFDRLRTLDRDILDLNKTLNLLEDEMYPMIARDALKLLRTTLVNEGDQLTRRMAKTNLVDL